VLVAEMNGTGDDARLCYNSRQYCHNLFREMLRVVRRGLR